jgi:hypothetical protein
MAPSLPQPDTHPKRPTDRDEDAPSQATEPTPRRKAMLHGFILAAGAGLAAATMFEPRRALQTQTRPMPRS